MPEPAAARIRAAGKTWLPFLLLLSAPARGAGAEPPADAAPSLSQVMEKARKDNPEIRAARKRWESLRARIASERSWEKPRVAYQQMYSGDEKIVSLSQEVPFPGKLRLKGRVAAEEAAMAEHGYRAKEREIVSKVKAAYAMYFQAVKSISIFEENVGLMRRFAKVAESKYAARKANQTDVLRAQVELSKMHNMLVTLNQEKETSQAMLNTLLNLPPDLPFGVPEEPRLKRLNVSLQKLQADALGRRPELLESRAAAERSAKALASSRLEYLPDIMAELRTRQAADPDMDNSNDVMVGLTLPLWFWKQRSMVEASKAEKEMSDAEYEAMRNMTLFQVKDLMVKTQTAERLVDLYRTSVIPQAEQALNISESSYQSDKTSFLELVDVVRNLLQFRIEHYQHLAEYEQRLAELERTVGEDLTEERP